MSDKKVKKGAAKKKVKHSGQFKKGHNRPGPGRPRLTPAERMFRGEHKEKFLGYLAELFDMSVEEIEKLAGNKEMSNGKMMFVRWYANRLEKPTNDDMNQLRKWFGIPDAPKILDHKSSDGSMSPVNITKQQELDILQSRLEKLNEHPEPSEE